MSEPGSEASTFEETKAEVRFALNQLLTQNRHHEFEHLSRMLALSTVTRNLLPATGPVSAGGDQGRDFETFQTDLPGQVQLLGRSWGMTEADGVGFTSTLQQTAIDGKLEDDVTAILAGGTEVRFIVAYCELDIPVGKRHAFQDRMREEHDIHVEIFDGNAISELLAQRAHFWIAEQYLHLSARTFPPNPDTPNWYEGDLRRWKERDDPPFTIGDRVDLTGSLRYATGHDELLVDLPFWLSKMNLFLGDDVPDIVRNKARYEIAVANLRGLGDLRPADVLAGQFIEAAIVADEPSDVKDGAVLLMYCMGAYARGLTNHSSAQLMDWNQRLRTRIEELLEGTEAAPLRRCACLDTLAMLCAQPDLPAMELGGTPYEIEGFVPRLSVEELSTLAAQGDLQPVPDMILVDRERALESWLELTELLGEAQLFPVQSLADGLNISIHNFAEDPRYDRIVVALDSRISEIEGSGAAAVRASGRAGQFLDSGHLLDALREMHRARSDWFSGDAARQMIFATLVTAEIYSRLHLYAASKYYALVAAALVHDEDLDLYPRALFAASFADYHQGAWFSAMQLADLAIESHKVFAEDPFDLEKHERLAHCLFEQGMIRGFAQKLGGTYEEFVDGLIEGEGLTEFLDDILSDLPEPPWWDGLSVEEFGDKVADELGRPAFSDGGPIRSIRWMAMGVAWTVEFINAYDDTMVGERIAAALQVILAEISRHDPVLLPTHIMFKVMAIPPDGTFDVDHSSDGHGTTFRVAVPIVRDAGHDAFRTATSGAIALAQTVFAQISLRTDDEIQQMFLGALEGGLMERVVFGTLYDIAYAGILKQPEFDDVHREQHLPSPPTHDGSPKPGHGLEFLEGPGPGYTVEEGCERALNRYEGIPRMLRSTLPVLRASPEFQAIVATLRNDGWLDWHILLAVFNVATNWRMNNAGLSLPPTRAEMTQFESTIREPEPEGDSVPAEEFTEDGFRDVLNFSLLTTLQQWGPSFRQNPPDIAAVRVLLDYRFGYSTDDVEHDDPFS